MSDNEVAPGTLDLLIYNINDIAREVGEMDPDDPIRAERLKELSALSQLSSSLKSKRNKINHKRMDELAPNCDVSTR